MSDISDIKEPENEYISKESEEPSNSRLKIALKSICLFIASLVILSLTGCAVVNICRYLHMYMPSGRGINLIASYGILFSYFICAAVVLIIIMYKYLDFKLNSNDNRCKNNPINITKPYIWIIRAIGVLFITPYIVLEIAFIIAFGAVAALSAAGCPFIGIALMLLGFNICSLTILIVILRYVYFTNYFNRGEQYNEA